MNNGKRLSDCAANQIMHRKILIAEDQPLMCKSLKAICTSMGIEDLQEVQTCRELLKVLKVGQYTHLILDLTLADGNALGALKEIFHRYPNLKILVYSSYSAKLYAESLWKRYGVRYVSKAVQESETENQLLEFLEGKKFADLQVAVRNQSNPFDDLAPKELEVLPHLLNGLSPSEIAEELKLEASTIRVLKKRILDKTKTENVVKLKELALRYKL